MLCNHICSTYCRSATSREVKHNSTSHVSAQGTFSQFALMKLGTSWAMIPHRDEDVHPSANSSTACLLHCLSLASTNQWAFRIDSGPCDYPILRGYPARRTLDIGYHDYSPSPSANQDPEQQRNPRPERCDRWPHPHVSSCEAWTSRGRE